MVTEVPVEYEVLLVVVVLGSPYRSCWLQLFVLLVIVPAGYCHFCWSWSLCCLWPSLYFVNNH